MLLKWIVCQVPEAKRVMFSEAQQQWADIASCPGFLGQAGGWHEHDACIAGCWQSYDAYQGFMKHAHDTITDKNHQAGTYDAIQVGLADVLLPMPGACKDISQVFAKATLLRVADCTLKPGRDAHFVDVQRRVWAPAMERSPGMLGGVFTQFRGGDSRYLVLTGWADEASHRHYVEHHVPRLRGEAEVERDVERLVGRVIPLVPEWRVVALGSATR